MRTGSSYLQLGCALRQEKADGHHTFGTKNPGLELLRAAGSLRDWAMKLRPVVRIVAMSAVVCAGAMSSAPKAAAQVIDFGQIDSFENLGTGTQRGESPPKTIV